MLFIFTILGVFALNVLTPGASFILTLQNAMAYGRKSGIWLGIGLSCVDLLYATAALMGLSALITSHAGVGQVIACLGGFWLSYLGLKLFKERKAFDVSSAEELIKKKHSLKTSFKMGFSAGIINPQAIIFFSSVFLGAMAFKPNIGDILFLIIGIFLVSLFLRCGLAVAATFPLIRQAYMANKQKMELLSGTALFLYGMKISVKALFPYALKVVVLAAAALHL